MAPYIQSAQKNLTWAHIILWQLDWELQAGLLNEPWAAIVRGQEWTFTLSVVFFYTRGIQHTSQYNGHAHVPDVKKN